MRYPGFLKTNGKIGFIAPSFGAVIEPYHTMFSSALDTFEKMGYKTVLGPNVYESSGVGKSNTPDKCGEEINDFFMNDKCDVIISCGGGETMCEDLPFVDFKGISESVPKWYLGYSDNTNLTALLPTLCDTAAIYGVCASNFGMKPWHKSIKDTFDILTGRISSVSNYDKWEIADAETDDPLAPYNVTEPFDMTVYNPSGSDTASFSGRLIGGCMDCLNIICGTQFDKMKEFTEKYKDDGIIWFLEACELTPMSVHRVLWQLDNAGWFNNVKGFLIGRPMLFEADGMGFDRFTAVKSVLGKYNVPILFDVDIGHLPPMMPIISGGFANVEAKRNSLVINYIFR